MTGLMRITQQFLDAFASNDAAAFDAVIAADAR